ncbi:MAG: hypothetical protein IKU08_04235 [Clostridia bacterium]|nr:hypothetical protein [Clostridia bacterium]
MIYDKLNVSEFTYRFEDFLPSAQNPNPLNRILNFLTAGPFVLETDGSFEKEHFYEREKLLCEDYLLPDGGEKNAVPELCAKIKNVYYGDDTKVWERGIIKWDNLRFDREGIACDPALYATEQRNAVYYAAFYIECQKEEKAIISYLNSGSSLYLNGELVDFRPYGKVKGLYGLGYQCLLHLRKGRNLIMFKLRPGYIADTIDISIATCNILPVIFEENGICLSLPLQTKAYYGTIENPKMVFHMFAAAEKDTQKAELICDGESYKIPEMQAGTCSVVHPGVSSGETEETVKKSISLHTDSSESKFDVYFATLPYDGYEGNEHVFSDFHFDTTYHQEQRTYALGAFHITKCLVEKLEENPCFKAILSEVDYVHPYYTLYPKHRKIIKDAFLSGRTESDCFYNQPNDLTSSGEAFVRNLVYGQLYHRDVLGRISRVYVPGDVYGHFSQISQVCRKGGCDMMRWGKFMLGVDDLFRHMSPDGTVMLHEKTLVRENAIRFGVKGCCHSSQATAHIEAFPREGDTSWMKKTLTNAKFSVFSDMADEVIKSDNENLAKGKNLIDLTSRDITQHHSGTLLTRTDFKQANRLCENLLVSAEKFAAVAFLHGAKYPEKAFDKAWRQLLTAQHHDSITGTNNEISFVDLMLEYREAAQTASEILINAARYIAAGVKTENRENTVLVFNPVPNDASGYCEFDIPEGFNGKFACLVTPDGNEIPVIMKKNKGYFLAKEIPATGYSVYKLKALDKDPDVHIFGNDRIIENEKFRLSVDSIHGGIISIYDKIENREWIDLTAPASGNAIYVLKEVHDRLEEQHEVYTTGHKLVSDEFDAEIESEKCSSFEKLKITSVLGTVAKVIREITLYSGSKTVDFRTVVEDYNSVDDMFCATFPMNVKGGAVIFDDRFAPHVSTHSKKYMSFQTHQGYSFSGCRILPSNRWFGIGPSVTVGTDEGKFNIGMTAVISKNKAVKASERLLATLTKKCIPVTLYPDTEQHGGAKIIHYNEDIYETDTRFVICIEGDGNLYYEKLKAEFSDRIKGKINKNINNNGISVVYLKDRDNAYNKAVDVILAVAKNEDKLYEFVSSIEKQLEIGYIINVSDCICADIPVESDNYGAEIINNGTVACSVEGKSTLNLMLFHTAAFYGNQGRVTGGEELVPEKKTHIFTYSLYPHKYSYREADTYGKAAIFNERIFAISAPEKKENAFLPERMSFLKSSEGFEITAFKAGGYPMCSMLDETKPISERGLVIRGFETYGTRHTINIQTDFEIKNAESSDLLEENKNPVEFEKNGISIPIDAHSIETFVISPEIPEPLGYAILGTEKDITEPTYVRSWEHDMGAVATGYLRFAATLDKKSDILDDFNAIINLNAVNNSADKNAEVNISIVCSEGLTADKESVSVSLAPEECDVIPFVVTKKSSDTKGQVKIYYEYDGQKFTDVYEFGYFNPEARLEIKDNKIICTVFNTTDQYLEGSLLLATPYETWGNIQGNLSSLGTISPYSYSVNLAPNEKKVYEFTADISDEEFFTAYYAAAKLCCNGRIHFAFADRHGFRHNKWSTDVPRVNGSIDDLLHM